MRTIVSFWEHFIRLLPRRPRAAISAVYWHVTGRRVRASNRLHVASIDLPFAYQMWIKRRERLVRRRAEFRNAVETWNVRPTFSVMLHADGAYTAEELDRSLKSLDHQIYPHWGLIEMYDQTLDQLLDGTHSDYLIPLRIGDALSEAALFRFAESLQDATPDVLYGDHDHLDERGRRKLPWFKPEWNRE